MEINKIDVGNHGEKDLSFYLGGLRIIIRVEKRE